MIEFLVSDNSFHLAVAEQLQFVILHFLSSLFALTLWLSLPFSCYVGELILAMIIKVFGGKFVALLMISGDRAFDFSPLFSSLAKFLWALRITH